MTSKPGTERRSFERFGMQSGNSPYIQTELNGAQVGLFIEDLSLGGAGLIWPDNPGNLRPGDHLPKCSIVLPEAEPIPVQVVIRWQVWPKIGVEFDGLSENARHRIARFLQAS
jgi:PilZ domain-containing protein